MLAILIDFALRSGMLLAMAFVLAAALRKNSAATRHLLWSLTSIAILLLPVFTIALPAWRVIPSLSVTPARAQFTSLPSQAVAVHPGLPNPIVVNTAAFAQTPSSAPASTIAASLPNATAKSELRVQTLVPAVYLIGVACSLFPLLVAGFALHRLRSGSVLLDEPPWPGRLRQARTALQTQRAITLLQSADDRTMPMTWGIFRPRILVPAGVDAWSADRRQLVLLHELAHVKRHDILTDTLARIACAICWFNPLAWLAARRLRIEAELACDDLVLGATTLGTSFKPSAYAGELLELATTFRRPAFPIAAIAMARGNNAQLHSRIHAILDTGRNRRRLTRLAAGASVSAAVFCAITLAIAQTAAPIPEQIRQSAQFHHFPAGDIAPTNLESPLGGWRNLAFTLSADQEADAKTCIALAHKVFNTIDGETEFSADAARTPSKRCSKSAPAISTPNTCCHCGIASIIKTPTPQNFSMPPTKTPPSSSFNVINSPTAPRLPTPPFPTSRSSTTVSKTATSIPASNFSTPISVPIPKAAFFSPPITPSSAATRWPAPKVTPAISPPSAGLKHPKSRPTPRRHRHPASRTIRSR